MKYADVKAVHKTDHKTVKENYHTISILLNLSNI